MEAAGRGGDGLGADLKRPGARGRAPTMPFVGGGCGQAGRFRGARGEDGADKRARAVSGWARAVAWCGRRRGCWAGDAEARSWAAVPGWARLLGRERRLG